VVEPTPRSIHARELLLSELRWFVSLRWLAGAAVVVLGMAAPLVREGLEPAVGLMALGGGILAYNGVLFLLLRRERPDGEAEQASPRPSTLAWAQILLDLAALTILILFTGATSSPLLGLYVLHMIFASLVLGSTAAYIAALLAIGLLVLGLTASQGWPVPREDVGPAVGWAAILWLTVFITNHITAALRRREVELSEAHDKLRQQQQALLQQEKMNTMGQMAAGITHEIANPLANMDSLLQLAERGSAGADGDTAKQLREQVRRIQSIVHHMRYFSHPTGGCWEDAELGDLLTQALEMVRFDHRIRLVRVERDLPVESGLVRVMPHAIQQVLINLIMNALDVLEGVEEPRLRLSARLNGTEAVIHVCDNGPGVPAGQEEQIFEPFHTTKAAGKGTGLGLAISRSLVQRHGGRLEVERREARGACFAIRLPLAPESRVREGDIGALPEGGNPPA
jgi:signal transduction histidine kinase